MIRYLRLLCIAMWYGVIRGHRTIGGFSVGSILVRECACGARTAWALTTNGAHIEVSHCPMMRAYKQLK